MASQPDVLAKDSYNVWRHRRVDVGVVGALGLRVLELPEIQSWKFFKQKLEAFGSTFSY